MSTTVATAELTWDLDTALRHIGPRGRWQMGVYILYALMYATCAFHFVSFIFIGRSFLYYY